MTTVQGYYDGVHYVTLEKIDIKPNQKITITVLDDFMPQNNRAEQIESLFGSLHQYANPALREKEDQAWEMAVEEKYGICRLCFRELAYHGQIPGVKKASW